jgi:hypothetical protein
MDKSRFGQQIREHMPVFCSNDQRCATVDHVEGNFIKLTKQGSPDGQHHWIPMDWVTRVDAQVHIDRSSDQTMREWLSTPPPAVMQPGEMPSAPPA